MKLPRQFAAQGCLSLILIFCVSQSRAQQVPVSASPAQLTFNSITNGPAAANTQTLTVSSTTGSPVAFTASTASTGGWLTVSPTSGTTPQALTITVSPNSLAAGTYAGFLTISTSTGTVTVPVNLNVNFFSAPPVTATPGSLFFGFLPGTTIPQTQQVNVATSQGGMFTATSSTSNGGNFLTVNPTTGTSPAVINVTVNPTGLTTGYYFGAVAVNPPGSTGLTIPVQVNIGVQDAINVNPQRLFFAYQKGTSAPAIQTIYLTTTSGPVGFTATPNTTDCIGKWLNVTPASGVAPGTLVVRIDPTGLQPGYCTGNIYIQAPGALNQNFSLPVQLLVSNSPVLQLPTTTPFLTFQPGGTTPGSITIPVASSGAPLDYSVFTSPAGSGPDFLTASPSTGTTPSSVTLNVNSSALTGLMPGIYGENVTFIAPDAGLPQQTITIPLYVSTSPSLVATPQTLSFAYVAGQTTLPASQMIAISSTGAALPYIVSSSSSNCSGFLSATTTTGTTPASGQQAQIVVSVNPTGLSTAQTCYGNVSISVPGQATPVTNIPVVLTVTTM